MAVFIFALSFASNTLITQILLLCIGTMGGIFIVPINAVLQEQGKHSIGSGRAVALQGFFQNLAMLVAVGTYTFASAHQVNPVSAMLSLGVIVFALTFLVSWHLPDTAEN
jgi:LPLT family lysophospholipid transporter-like MFS transporter